MILITSNAAKQLVYVQYFGRVKPEDFQTTREEFLAQVRAMKPGFRLLADLSQLESMNVACAPELGQMMTRVAEAGIGRVLRVIPDPKKDIGMNILAAFRYRGGPRPITCDTLAEAVKVLAL